MKKIEYDLEKRKKRLPKINFSQFLLNLGAYLSWGWLSSIRFLKLFFEGQREDNTVHVLQRKGFCIC
jgi:hypothetical protein